MRNVPIPEVYVKPSAPRSNWEIFKWLFLEPSLLESWADEYEEDYMGNKKKFIFIYCFIFVPIILTFCVFMIWVCILFNFYIFEEEIYLPHIQADSERELVLAFILILTLRLVLGLALGLVVGLVLGTNGSEGGRLDIRLGVGLAVGLAAGLTLGLTIFGMPVELALELALGLAAGLLVGLLGVVLGGALGGLCFAVVFYVIQFRLLFYPVYLLQFFKKYTLLKNPYLHDQVICLPLRWVNQALRQQAKQEPELALHFVNFLLRYRPLQSRFAAELERIATAALWRSELRLYSYIFEERHFLEEVLPKEWKKFAPSSAWRKKIREIRETLRSVEATTAIVSQQSLLQSCGKLIEEFEAINLRESFRGREEYFPVIEHWKQVLGNQLQEVAEKVAASQAITLNPYSKGNALTPTLAASSPLFLDRADIKEELSLKIQTSAIMPTFLILGQRRVGKTSLLNFLPRLLDPNLYDVVVVDAQGLAGESSLLEWLKFWRRQIESQLRLPASAPEDESNPLQTWDHFAAFLDDLAQKRQRRLILAMDEYDEDRGLHYAIRQDPELGAAFLGRMRAFAQRQKLVVFLFVGASYFSDLPEPKWSKYFVQTHIVRVDYLSEVASMQLIERPVPNFALRYAPGVAEQIYQLTQGHPHLLHSICSDLVDYANGKVKNPIEHSDLEYILRHNIVLRGEQPFSVFWDEFCAATAMQEAVKAIAFGQVVDAQQVEVRKLADYGYIVADGVGGYRMRVPLFADWVRQFGY